MTAPGHAISDNRRVSLPYLVFEKEKRGSTILEFARFVVGCQQARGRLVYVHTAFNPHWQRPIPESEFFFVLPST